MKMSVLQMHTEPKLGRVFCTFKQNYLTAAHHHDNHEGHKVKHLEGHIQVVL